MVSAVMFALLRAFDLMSCFMNMIDYYLLEAEGSVCVYCKGSQFMVSCTQVTWQLA